MKIRSEFKDIIRTKTSRNKPREQRWKYNQRSSGYDSDRTFGNSALFSHTPPRLLYVSPSFMTTCTVLSQWSLRGQI